MITRYNRSFYNLGPLVQSGDGELVKYVDHIEIVDELDEKIQQCQEDCRSQVTDLIKELVNYQLMSLASITSTVILLVLLVNKW